MTAGPVSDRHWRLFAIGACFAAEIFFSTAAHSQSQNWDWCSGKNSPTPDQRIAACTAIIETGSETPTNQAKAFSNRGVAHAINGHPERAIQDYEESLRLDSTSASSHRVRGNKYWSEKNYESAIAEYNEAIKLDPTDVLAFSYRGRAYHAKGDNTQAISDFDQAIQLNPKSANAFVNRGNVHQSQKDYARAIVDYSEAIRLDPASFGAFSNLGTAHYYVKDYDRAIADYSEAIRINSKFAAAFIGRGHAYREKGNTEQAISNYDQAIQLDPKSTSAFLSRGNAHLAQKEIARALADYDQAIQIDPTLATAYSARCAARITAGQDLQSALSDCNESLRLRPDQVTALNHRGFVHLKLGSVTQAMADFDAALAKDAGFAWSLYGRGLVKWKKGDRSGAEADIAAATKSRSGIAGAVYEYYGAAAEPELAIRVWNTYAKANPMVFFIARGNPDACGSGCDEWIAADGAFDQGVEKRFRNFLDTLKGHKPPIFFNSTGGELPEAYAIGRILRERKMTASVGATIPVDCRTSTEMDAACRQLVQSKRDLKAELRTPGAECHSACVYALIGASVRQIPDGALLGVHAPARSSTQTVQLRRSRDPADEQRHVARLSYAQQMGVDPELVELADKTPHASIHILTRDEIVRFRVETPQR